MTGGYNAVGNQRNAQQSQFQNPPSQGQYGFVQQSQYQSPESFHTANYKGNQPGHDMSLRSDSAQPGASQFAGGVSQ